MSAHFDRDFITAYMALYLSTTEKEAKYILSHFIQLVYQNDNKSVRRKGSAQIQVEITILHNLSTCSTAASG